MKVTTDNFTVEIFDETSLRGYFEHNELGDNCAGELLFDGLLLIDYDGVFELPKEVIQALRGMSFYVDEGFESGSVWDSPPKYCPFCGGKNIYNDVALWSSVSEDDQNNKAVLDEHQCQDCGNRSFWA